MSVGKYREKLTKKIVSELSASRARFEPILAKDVEGKNLVNYLGELLQRWPMQDIRLEEKIIWDCRNIVSTDEELMRETARGMRLSILKRDLGSKTLEAVVKFQKNIDEYHAYNEKVRKHNNEWNELGRPNTYIDPKTGDPIKAADTYVAPAEIESPFDKRPTYDSGSRGELARSRPVPRYAPVVSINYHIELIDDIFYLEYVARDMKNRVLYYNRIQNDDLSHLIRRSTQELWGNPFLKGHEGPFLEGISQLIQGKKLGICKKENVRPSILGRDETFKTPDIEAKYMETEEKSLGALSSFLITGAPILSVFTLLIFTFVCFIQYEADSTQAGLQLTFLGGLTLTLTLAIACPKWGYYLRRRAKNIRYKRKFH